jgi:uncharacterized membrane protein
MTTTIIASRALNLTSLILTGAIAGFFYAYWCSVMIGLDAAGAPVAIPAMQGINRMVRNMMFAPAFFGPMAVLPLAAVVAWLTAARATAAWLVLAFLAYASAFVMTLAINVPMNEAFAAVPASEVARWARYFADWGFWNGARTFTSFLALACVGLALMAERRADQPFT